MTKISVRPKSIDIKIDGKSPSDWFAELEKAVNAKFQSDIAYGTRVRMNSDYNWLTGKIDTIRTDSIGTTYKIILDKPYEYERSFYDGWTSTREITCKREQFTLLEQ